MTDSVPAQTSVPDWLMTYCRQLAEVHYSRKLNRMYIHMLQCFLANSPWEANPPFPWRVARIHRTTGLSKNGADAGWVPMNMVLPLELINQVKLTIEMINANKSDDGRERVLSVRTFLYTVICWWVTFVFPYSGPGVLA